MKGRTIRAWDLSALGIFSLSLDGVRTILRSMVHSSKNQAVFHVELCEQLVRAPRRSYSADLDVSSTADTQVRVRHIWLEGGS
jgi:hypothetical protein